jgi:PAS domain S-box-containing protein
MEINKQLLQFIQKSTDIVITFDETDKIIYANDSVKNHLGVNIDDFKSKGIEKFVHVDDLEKAKNYFKDLKTNCDTFMTEKFRLLSNSGKIISFHWNSLYCKDSKETTTIARAMDDQVAEDVLGDAKRLARVGMWEYHVESNFFKWDKQVFEIYELSEATEINLNRMKQFFRKESLVAFEIKMKQLIEHGVSFDEELSFVSGKFKPSTARFMAKAEKSDQRTIVKGTIQDLTDVRRIERKAEDYQEAVDKSSIVSITDRYGVITEVNDRFCEISKYSRQELIGKTHSVINSTYHDQDFWKDMWEQITKGEVWTGEIQNKAKDGSFFWVDTTIIPFKNSIGRIYQYLAIQRDFTENKKLNEELMVSEKLSSIGEISAQILHEVMTPLSIISLSIENLEDDIEDLEIETAKLSPIRTNLTEIKMNYEKIEEIFENMRSILVRKNSGEPTAVPVKETLEKSLSLVKAKLKSRDINVKYDNVAENINIKCTQSDLSQVFLNLINNAADAIERLEDRWIDVKAEVKGSHVTITFQDSGAGIPEEIRSKIFDTLFTTKGESSGTGLGMGVCKKLIERHLGMIKIDEKAKNTTFVITFPLHQ